MLRGFWVLRWVRSSLYHVGWIVKAVCCKNKNITTSPPFLTLLSKLAMRDGGDVLMTRIMRDSLCSIEIKSRSKVANNLFMPFNI